MDSFQPGEKVDVSIQSAFRESEAQTDPWLPETVEHTRPRAWYEEEELENLSIEDRQKRLVELEVEQWAKREKQIVDIQQKRLNAIAEQFQKREDAEGAVRLQRVEHVVRANETHRQKQVAVIAKNRLKVLRTLTEQRRQMTEKKHSRRDIVKEYANAGSGVYSPLKREGRADAQAYMNKAVYGRRDILINHTLEELDDIEKRYQMGKTSQLKTELPKNRTEKKHMESLATVELSVKQKRGGVERKTQNIKNCTKD